MYYNIIKLRDNILKEDKNMKASAKIRAYKLPQGTTYFIIGERVYEDGTVDEIRNRKASLREAITYCKENEISYTF
jgi:hypothetical protein